MATSSQRQILICGVQYDRQLRSGAMTVLELAPIAARLGAQGVEYREVYWRDKATELPAVRDQAAGRGLLATYATFTTLFNRDPAAQRQLLQDLEDAHTLGSPLMRVFRGPRPWDDPEGDAMLSAARQVIDRAAAYGMRLALENFRGTPGNRMEEVREALERLASPVMGVNLDTSNYALNQQDPLAMAQALAPHIIYCHLKDVHQTPKGLDATYLGNGILPLREIIAVIETTGRPIPLCFEFNGGDDPEAAITKSLQYVANR